MDSAQVYNPIELEEESKPYVTVNTSRDCIHIRDFLLVFPQLLQIFPKSIEQVLQGLTDVQGYFDDILITGKDDTEHLKNLEAVMEWLSKFGLQIRPDKCVYL